MANLIQVKCSLHELIPNDLHMTLRVNGPCIKTISLAMMIFFWSPYGQRVIGFNQNKNFDKLIFMTPIGIYISFLPHLLRLKQTRLLEKMEHTLWPHGHKPYLVESHEMLWP